MHFPLILIVMIVILFLWHLYQRAIYRRVYRNALKIFHTISQDIITIKEDESAHVLEERLEEWSPANRFSHLYRYDEILRHEELRQRLTDTPLLLDVGCGDGYLLGLLKKNTPEVKSVGLDIALSRLKLARTRTESPYIAGNAEVLPFKDGVFDIVISTENLEHLISVENAVGEIIRVTRPGGLMLVTVPSRHLALVKWHDVFSWIEAVASIWCHCALRPFHNVYKPNDPDTVIHRAFTIAEVRALFSSCTISHVSTMRFPSFLKYIIPGKALLQFEQRLLGKMPLCKHLGKDIILVAIK